MTEIQILKKRKDFVRVARQGFKMVGTTLILQAAQSLSAADEQECCHLGYTATKKIGKAHIRNRTKRRLGAAAREIFPKLALPGKNYVLIGRFNTGSCKYDILKKDMETALKRINKFFKNSDDAKTSTTVQPAADIAD